MDQYDINFDFENPPMRNILGAKLPKFSRFRQALEDQDSSNKFRSELGMLQYLVDQGLKRVLNEPEHYFSDTERRKLHIAAHRAMFNKDPQTFSTAGNPDKKLIAFDLKEEA